MKADFTTNKSNKIDVIRYGGEVIGSERRQQGMK